MVVTELIKKRTNARLDINLFYWRDNAGHELDVLIERGNSLVPVEIKSGRTISDLFFRNLNFWAGLTGEKNAYLFYGGKEPQTRSDGKLIMNWRQLSALDL